MRSLLAAAIGLASLSPLALVVVPVPTASSQVRRELRLTPRSEAIGLASLSPLALIVAPGVDSYYDTSVTRELLGVGIAWRGERYLTSPARCWFQRVHHLGVRSALPTNWSTRRAIRCWLPRTRTRRLRNMLPNTN